MHEEFSSLIKDTLAYLKDPLLPKQSYFVSREEALFFQAAQKMNATVTPVYQESKKAESIQIKTPSSDAFKLAPPREKPPQIISYKDQPPAAKQDIKKTDGEEHYSSIRKTLQRIAPHLKLTSQVPDDTTAKRVATAWQERIPDVEVVLIACDSQPETLELLKNLAKAIDTNLAKAKVISAERLEQKKRWDAFLDKNPLRLIVASSAIFKLSDLKRFYKAVPSQNACFLAEIPLLILAEPSAYRSIELKAQLWKALCLNLKK